MEDDEAEARACIADLRQMAVGFEAALSAGIEIKGRWWRQMLGASLMRAASQCRSIASLAEIQSYLDADILVRALVELAITVGWMGDDEAKAEGLRDSGLKQMGKWKEAMEQHDPLPAPALARFNKCMEASGGKSAPPVEQRAQGIPLLKEAYAFSYRRASSSAHTDLRVLTATMTNNERDHAAIIMHDACMAAVIIAKVAAAAFGDDGLQSAADALEKSIKSRS